MTQRKTAEKIIQMYGLLDRSGIPDFNEFVHQWLPAEFLQMLIQKDGGRQGASSSATLEMLYSTFIATKSGGSRFQVKPGLIEALRDTEVPELPIEMLKSPFEGFFIIVPRGTFQSPAEQVEEICISNVAEDRFRVMFNQGEYSHYINILTDNPEESIASAMERTLGENTKMPDYLKEEVREESMYPDYFKSDILRFAINLVLYVTCPEADMYQDKTAEHRIHQKLQGIKGSRKRDDLLSKLQKAKEKKTFIVGANVRLQKEYMATLTETGKKWMLKHRCRVIGHWRQQSYGPEHSLRRPQWISPYYKGPTYAEMIEKGYVVK